MTATRVPTDPVPKRADGPVRPWRRILLRCAVLLAAAVVVAGSILLIVDGNHHSDPKPGPLPSQQFSAATGGALPVLPGDSAPPSTGAAPTFGAPNRLYIHSIGVSAPLIDETISGGELTIPGDVHQVGRWTGGADLDGSRGTVLLAGHVNFADQGNGALFRLYQVRRGALAVTTDASGLRHVWQVVGLQVVEKSQLPTSIFARTGPRRLVVVTCGGPLLTETAPDGHTYRTYRDNVIVTAVPLAR